MFGTRPASGAYGNSSPNRVRAAWGSGGAPPNLRGKRMTIDDHPLALGRGELGIEFTAWISVAIIIERWQTMNALDSDHLERSERVLCVRGIAW